MSINKKRARSITKRVISLVFILVISLFVRPRTSTNTLYASDDWLPIAPEDLALKDNPASPGANAMILYRESHVNEKYAAEDGPFVSEYIRIKIFTQEGTRQGDVEIPFIKDSSDVKDIRARTIHPDGTVINFDGKVFENTIVKSKTQKYLAKTFTLPDVQVGSIIEYKYIYDFADYWIYFSQWVISMDLFTKKAEFSLKPYERFPVQWSWPAGLPEGTNAPVDGSDHVIRMTSVNVPAFQVEDHMPPEDEVKYRIVFVYSEDGFETDADKFWRKFGKKQFDQTEKFMDRRKAMEQALGEIVAPGDSAEVKLKKIYARRKTQPRIWSPSSVKNATVSSTVRAQ